MNKLRRTRLAAVLSRLSELQSLAAELQSEVQAVHDEEVDALDALPESIQSGERGDTMQQAIDELSNACDSLGEFDELANTVESAINAATGDA